MKIAAGGTRVSGQNRKRFLPQISQITQMGRKGYLKEAFLGHLHQNDDLEDQTPYQ
jgi:hypothetical protein